MSESETSATSSVSSESEPDESGSRSSFPTPVLKDGEVENEASAEHLVGDAVETLDASSLDRASADAEGLTLIWQADAGQEELKPLLPNFDIVVIHGFHASRQSPWVSPGSGSSEWVNELDQQEGRAVLCFGYEPSRLLAGRRTRDAIRRVSRRLLDDLTEHRASSDKPRPIMFAAHDIGGIIVKDALTYAGLHPGKYGQIFDYCRVILFYGCPHHSKGELDMQDRLSTFLLRHSNDSLSHVRNIVAATQGLAEAVLDVNNFFLDSKHAYRSHVISFTSSATNPETCTIDKVFDKDVSYMRIPFERRLSDYQPEYSRFVMDLLRDLKDQIVPDSTTIEQERKLLAIARPISALTTVPYPEGKPHAWIVEDDATYRTWFEQRMPQILYLHGSAGVRQAAEYIFYDLNRKLRVNECTEMVLYFTFDRSDIRYDTTADMLTTFLAQIICHNPSLAEFVVDQFKRLAVDRSWSDYDLLSWFQYYRLRGQVTGVTCVINHFEECEEQSRKAFLYVLSELSKTQERPWRIVVTSRKRGALSEELAEWPSIDLDTAMFAPKPEPQDGSSLVRLEHENLIRRRPELQGVKVLDAELEKIAALEDPAVRELVLEQVSGNSLWPEHKSLEAILGGTSNLSFGLLLDRVMTTVPDKDLACKALSWITYPIRPLTIWELGTALFLGSEEDDGKSLLPDREFVHDVIQKLLSWFAGFIHLDQDEVRIKSPEIRELLETGWPGGDWSGVPAAEAEYLISQSCLDLLLREQAQEYLETIYGDGKDDIMTCTTLGDRSNLCTYAVLYWPMHLSRIPSHLNPGDLLDKLQDSKAVPIWSKAYWSLASPIERSPEHFISIFPVLAGMGMTDIAEPLRRDDQDISAGLVEACLNGFPKVVQDLLGRTKHSAKTMQDALVAAGSKGDEGIWMNVIQYVRRNYQSFEWPPSLLARAAWLGLEQIVSELLDVGADPNPKDVIQLASPLYLAARNGHWEVTKTLLEHGADQNHQDQYGRNAVHVATVFAHHQVVKLLVEKTGLDINAKDNDGVTAVYSGCLWGNWKAVEVLLGLGADPDIGVDEAGKPQWNPLVAAVEEGHVACARLLLEAGANPNFEGPAGTPVRFAVVKWRPELVRMLTEKGASLNHPSIDPPILIQALTVDPPDNIGAGSRLGLIKYLVEKGARTDIVDGPEETQTPLIIAARGSNSDVDRIPIILYLLDQGLDINAQRVDGDTALQVTVWSENFELTKVLIDKGAYVNPPKDNDRRVLSPLHIAVITKCAEIALFLLEQGADVNYQTAKVAMPLLYAVSANSIDFVALLLKYNPEVDAEDTEDPGWTAIAQAAAWGFGEVVRLLGDAGANVDYRVDRGRSLLHWAFQKDTLPVLLEFRPDIDAVDDDGDTPLHYIVPDTTPFENVKLLVRAGARLDIQNQKGVTALGEATRRGDWGAATYLLTKSSRDMINLASPTYGSPLHLACGLSNLDMIKALVEKGADVHQAVSSSVGTPLQSAILGWGREEVDADAVAAVVDYLLEAGADVCQVGGLFSTAIAAAAIRGSATLLTTLLERGATPSVPDTMGRLPIHLASLHGADYFRVIIDAAGDEMLVRDKAGRTALHWAAQGGHVSVVERILQDTGNEMVNQVDVDGWTALCWAARGSETHFESVARDRQIDTIRLLVEKGADVTVECSLPGKTWKPVDIARYHWQERHVTVGDVDEVMELLQLPEEGKKQILKKKGVKEEEAKEEEGERDRATGQDKERPSRQEKPSLPRLTRHNYSCNYCLSMILGVLYECEVCADFSVCYKCHNSRSSFHPTHHTFKEQGPEFVEESVSGTEPSTTTAEEDDTTDEDDSLSEQEEDSDSDGEEGHKEHKTAKGDAKNDDDDDEGSVISE